MDLGLTGHVVLVTGGVRGVGAGISRTLTSMGATVVACARRESESLPEGVTFVPCDVREPESVQKMITAIMQDFGRLDGVVNNAGGAPFALAAEASPNFHRKIVELNMLAPLLVSQEAYKVMGAGGAIVNISSVSGHRPSPGTAGYGAAKAGLDSLTQSLAVEWAPAVRVNSVVVGPVHTELSHLHYGDDEGIAAVGDTIPMRRMARPDDVGNACAFLLSPLAAFITGSTLTVHGGGERPAFLDAANVERD